jgi:hypothetical protein
LLGNKHTLHSWYAPGSAQMVYPGSLAVDTLSDSPGLIIISSNAIEPSLQPKEDET